MENDGERYILINGVYNREYVTFKKNKTYFKYFDMIQNEFVCISFTNGSRFNNFNHKDNQSSPCIVSVENTNWTKDLIYDVDTKELKLFKNFRLLKNKNILNELKDEHPEYFI